MLVRVSVGILLMISASCVEAAAAKSVPTSPKGQNIGAKASILAASTGKVVVLDPGHGGKELGTHSEQNPKYEEKRLALSTAHKVRDALEKLGYRVVMTRTNDVTLSLKERVDIAEKAKGDLFISIHYNSAPSKEAHGVEVFYYDDSTLRDKAADSKKLGQMALDAIVEKTEANKRKNKHANFVVVRDAKSMPAILIECGFLTNDQELTRCQESSYQKKIAQGIAYAVEFFFAQKRLESLDKL